MAFKLRIPRKWSVLDEESSMLETALKHLIVCWQREAIALEHTGKIDNLVVAEERRQCARTLAQLLEAQE